MQKPSRPRDSPTYQIEGISGEAPSAFPKGQTDLTHTLPLFAGFQSRCTLTRQALWRQNTDDTDACWSLWLQASRTRTFVNYGWLLPQFYTELSFVKPLHEDAFILSLKPPQFCLESHSFGNCSLWFPYLLLITIILCDNSSWRSLYLYLTKEWTHVCSVTLLHCSSQEMGILVAQWQSSSGRFLSHHGLLLWARSVLQHCSKLLGPPAGCFVWRNSSSQHLY